MKKTIFAWILCCMAFLPLLGGGCYRVGSLMHPQIHTVAVAPVVNETNVYNASAIVRQLLRERFMVDGSLKVKEPGDADCEVFVRITSVSFAEKSASQYSTWQSDRIYMPKEWTAVVSADFTVVVPGRGVPLLGGTASGSSTFQVQADLDTNRANGIRQAARELANAIVTMTTEAW